MEDAFDRLEKTYNELNGPVLLILEGGHKRKSKSRNLYFCDIGSSGLTLTWVTSPSVSAPLFPYQGNQYYEKVKKLARRHKVGKYKLVLLRDIKAFKNNNKNIQSLVEPVRKTWWERFKVWFSRKVEEFCLPNESGDD